MRRVQDGRRRQTSRENNGESNPQQAQRSRMEKQVSGLTSGSRQTGDILEGWQHAQRDSLVQNGDGGGVKRDVIGLLLCQLS